MGDAALVLDAIIAEVKELVAGPRGRADGVAAEIARINGGWRNDWAHKTDCDESPLNPYRVLRDLHATLTRRSASTTWSPPTTRAAPATRCRRSGTRPPRSATSAGARRTQLGYGLGLAMGAKIARPEKTCLNVWGDAAIGMTGMDFETAVRENIPILSILLNNFSMAIELPIMKTATEKYRATDISGNYADMAKAFGGYGERVTEVGDIKEAVKRGHCGDGEWAAGAAGVHHQQGDRFTRSSDRRVVMASVWLVRADGGSSPTSSARTITSASAGVLLRICRE